MYQRGLSLIEFLVTLTIAGLVLSGIAHLWLQTESQVLKRQQKMESIQSLFHTRAYLDLLLERAGFKGCFSAKRHPEIEVSDNQVRFFYADAGYEHEIFFLNSGRFRLNPPQHRFKEADLVLITNCNEAFVTTIQAVAGTDLQFLETPPWMKRFSNQNQAVSEMWIYPFREVVISHKNGKIYQGREPFAVLDQFKASQDGHLIQVELKLNGQKTSMYYSERATE